MLHHLLEISEDRLKNLGSWSESVSYSHELNKLVVSVIKSPSFISQVFTAPGSKKNRILFTNQENTEKNTGILHIKDTQI